MKVFMESPLLADTIEELEAKLLDLHRYFEKKGIPERAAKVSLRLTDHTLYAVWIEEMQ